MNGSLSRHKGPADCDWPAVSWWKRPVHVGEIRAPHDTLDLCLQLTLLVSGLQLDGGWMRSARDSRSSPCARPA